MVATNPAMLFGASSATAGGFANGIATTNGMPEHTTYPNAVMVAGDVWGAALSKDGGLNYLMSRGGSSGMRNLAVTPGLVNGKWYRQFGGSNGAGPIPSSYSGGIAVLTADSPVWEEWATPLLANTTKEHPRGVGNNMAVVRVGTATRVYIATNDGVKSVTDPGAPYAGRTLANWALKGPALPGAQTHAIVVPDPVNKPLEVYVGVEAGGPGPGLYRVLFNADGSPSATAAVKIAGPTGRIDDIGSVIEDGVRVVYTGGANGVWRYPTTGTASTSNIATSMNGSGVEALPVNNTTWCWSALCFKPMPTGRAVVYASCSPEGSAVLPRGGNHYRTIDGGSTWQRVDENATITIKGDASGDQHYALTGRAQFRIGGNQYDMGSSVYLVGVAPNTDRVLFAGRTCVYGAEITTSAANPKGAVGRLSIYGKGINGSVGQGVAKDHIRGDVWGLDTDWKALKFIAYPASSGYTDFLRDRLPRSIGPTSRGHGLSSGFFDSRGCGWFGGGARDDVGVGSIGYSTTPHLTPTTWYHSDDAGSPLQLIGGGNVTGIGVAYLPSNYTASAFGGVGQAGDAVVMYSQPPTAGVASSGGVFTALVRFPAGTGVFTTAQAISSSVRPFQASFPAANMSGARTRFAIGRLGVNAAGTAAGTQGWIYALVMGVGLFRSSNYGNTFTLIDAAVGPASRAAGTLAQNPDDPDQLIYMGATGPKRILNGRAATPTIETLTALSGTTPLASVATVKDGAGDVHVFASRNVNGAQPGRVFWSGNAWTAAAASVTWTQQDNDTFASIGAEFHDMQAVVNPADGKPRIIMAVTDGGYMVGYSPTTPSNRTVEAPANLTAAPVGSTGMLLDWTAPNDNAINGYEVQRLIGTTWTTLATYTGAEAVTAHTDRDLASSTSYQWRVRSLAIAPGVNSPYVTITRSTTGASASPPTAVLTTTPALIVEDGVGLVADASESVAVAPATIVSIRYSWGDDSLDTVVTTDPFIPDPHVYESVPVDTQRVITATAVDSSGLTGSASVTITQRPTTAIVATSRNYGLPYPTVPGEPMYRFSVAENGTTPVKVWTPGPRLRQLVDSLDGLLFERRLVETFPVTIQAIGNAIIGPRIGKGIYYVETASELLSVRVTSSLAITGTPVVLDIMKNETSVFPDPTDRPTIAIGQTTTLNLPRAVIYSPGDRLRVDIVSGTVPIDELLTVTVRLRRVGA